MKFSATSSIDSNDKQITEIMCDMILHELNHGWLTLFHRRQQIEVSIAPIIAISILT